ncbi:glycogen/starch synthase [Hoylesella shahii]|uniref:glycogen/starch synthase n=1 Tax=Hoylesella shahii TaxID=228603 RepID=UPI00288B942B|nr:glycogen/starch synthase [Hoylesella shahii]
MNRITLFPDYILESSWEVCNKVGGIYTVLSTRAQTLQTAMPDRIIFVGPLLDESNTDFQEVNDLYPDWAKQARANGLGIKVGRWNVPGSPVAVLVDFKPFFSQKDMIYAELWESFQVDSLHGYGDYDEASMFSYAAAKVVESFCRYQVEKNAKVIYHGNEWMAGLGLLYIRKHLPEVATIFTTHATSIGRSIAGNNKPLYEYLFAYNGDQMANELNMQSKHSIEKQTAWNVDCFTTVSDITANECRELLDKVVDVVLPNGFEDDFVPKGSAFTAKRKRARAEMLRVANGLTGDSFGEDTLIVSTSGRYEFRNKGIDVFIDAMNRLRFDERLNKKVVAFVDVPAWVGSAREDLAERLNASPNTVFDTPLPCPMLTHWLHNMEHDNVLTMLRALDFANNKQDKVKIIFVPCYLNGNDGIFNMPYYDLILGNDICVYPSYYEPWGYTPLEAVAFSIPCVTTDLAGFGIWAQQVLEADKAENNLSNGVKVVHRTDYNYHEVADEIKDAVANYALLPKTAVTKAREKAKSLSKKALWKKFIAYYNEAYHMALTKTEERTK